MFKFDFSSTQLVDKNEQSMALSKDLNEQDNLKWILSQEIFPDSSTDQDKPTQSVVFLSKELIYVKPSIVLSKVKDESLNSEKGRSLADCNDSDLMPAIYEGGLKIWECTHDIGKYLESIDFKGKSVLDLGCGVGLLGILALKLGAQNVFFQDYNVDVLRHATIPNVRLNTCESDISRCRFFSGDWDSFTQAADFTCELILSSETIYNPGNHLKLHNTIHKFLNPGGIALIGAKTYYFGVGGGTRQFEHLINEKHIFDVEVVWKSCEGVLREILKLTLKEI